nr:MAG TPA: hypothetical protein [Caudoviricetes sp.]
MINANNCTQFIKANAPAILAASACIGTVTTAILTAKSTTLAIERIADYCEANLRSPDDLSWREKFAISYRVYIPPAIAGVATLVSIVAANRIQYARGAAFALAYSGSEAAFRRYREAVSDVVKPKDIQKVAARVAEKSVQEAGQPHPGSVLVASSGDVLCYDTFSGRYFKSDIETIRRVENNINGQLNSECYASLNEFYAGLGLPPVSAGELVGWSDPNALSVEFGSLLTEKGEPVLTIDFLVAPKENYFKIN